MNTTLSARLLGKGIAICLAISPIRGYPGSDTQLPPPSLHSVRNNCIYTPSNGDKFLMRQTVNNIITEQIWSWELTQSNGRPVMALTITSAPSDESPVAQIISRHYFNTTDEAQFWHLAEEHFTKGVVNEEILYRPYYIEKFPTKPDQPYVTGINQVKSDMTDSPPKVSYIHLTSKTIYLGEEQLTLPEIGPITACKFRILEYTNRPHTRIDKISWYAPKLGLVASRIRSEVFPSEETITEISFTHDMRELSSARKTGKK
ncbi:hypothetical protein FNU76_22270 [Chitinimonas arctica]|uniref:Uncharacterized protein n=1 Tax=Chitinimonas arctica TaxID=2594795 RepID=A0A516SL29_9NEIS|nr:hypothetical protein [Chitinimonas arctica]QDQ28855.1 hypothetical protein FNU76_22270 [Chitinimonas arctica]